MDRKIDDVTDNAVTGHGIVSWSTILRLSDLLRQRQHMSTPHNDELRHALRVTGGDLTAAADLIVQWHNAAPPLPSAPENPVLGNIAGGLLQLGELPPPPVPSPRAAVALPRTAVAPPRAAVALPRTAVAPPRAAFAPPRAAFAPPRAAFAPPRAAFAPPRAAFAQIRQLVGPQQPPLAVGQPRAAVMEPPPLPVFLPRAGPANPDRNVRPRLAQAAVPHLPHFGPAVPQLPLFLVPQQQPPAQIPAYHQLRAAVHQYLAAYHQYQSGQAAFHQLQQVYHQLFVPAAAAAVPRQAVPIQEPYYQILPPLLAPAPVQQRPVMQIEALPAAPPPPVPVIPPGDRPVRPDVLPPDAFPDGPDPCLPGWLAVMIYDTLRSAVFPFSNRFRFKHVAALIVGQGVTITRDQIRDFHRRMIIPLGEGNQLPNLRCMDGSETFQIAMHLYAQSLEYAVKKTKEPLDQPQPPWL